MTIHVPGSRVPPEGRWGAARQVGGTGSRYGHQGIDRHAPKGTPVYARQSGRLFTSGRSPDTLPGSYGYWRVYDFGTHHTLLAHLLDGRGATGTVQAGAVLGYVGNTGNARFGPPHVHEEARVRGVKVDPGPFYTAFASSTPRPIGDDEMPTVSEFLNHPAWDGGPTVSEHWKQMHEVYAGLYKGGASTPDRRPLVDVLSDLHTRTAAAVWHSPVERGGPVPALQEVADSKTLALQIVGQIAGLNAALGALAQLDGSDPAAVRQAALDGATAGVRAGLEGAQATVRIDLSES